jgi:hypothetical protein
VKTGRGVSGPTFSLSIVKNHFFLNREECLLTTKKGI